MPQIKNIVQTEAKPYNYLGVLRSVKKADKSSDDFLAKLIVLFISITR